ncbi:BPSL0067 family protein [Massilia sp. S19_KUP03_FR1]|uniref:BPSL0067 family protein n=1 Tax=Massilia sp. S19_KUP03_FR1 TaxID=3025503 RepID=UPI002FCDD1BE
MAHVYHEVNSLEKHALIGDGNCVALVQKLTNVGHTSQWRPQARVMDSLNIAPGTVIATFEDGRYPNRHTGNHAAFYLYSGPRSMKTGKPAYIVVMDQWTGKGQVSARSIYPKARSLSIGLTYDDSDNAEMFYVVN